MLNLIFNSIRYLASRFDEVKFRKIEQLRLDKLADGTEDAAPNEDGGGSAPIDIGGATQYDRIDFDEYTCTNVTLTAGDRLYLPYVMAVYHRSLLLVYRFQCCKFD